MKKKPDVKMPDLHLRRRKRLFGLPIGPRETDWARVGLLGAGAATLLTSAGRAVAGLFNGHEQGASGSSSGGSDDEEGATSEAGQRREQQDPGTDASGTSSDDESRGDETGGPDDEPKVEGSERPEADDHHDDDSTSDRQDPVARAQPGRRRKALL